MCSIPPSQSAYFWLCFERVSEYPQRTKPSCVTLALSFMNRNVISHNWLAADKTWFRKRSVVGISPVFRFKAKGCGLVWERFHNEKEWVLGKEAEFSRVRENYGAQERLADIRKRLPDDPKPGRELGLLAPQAADFTLALGKFHHFKTRNPKQTGFPLTWLLKAGPICPQSTKAYKGFKIFYRLLNPILPVN